VKVVGLAIGGRERRELSPGDSGIAIALVVAVLAIAPTAAALGWLPSPARDERHAGRPSMLAGHAIISDADAAEMTSLRGLITEPTRTLVVAAHGLEWWAGFYLKTAVAEGKPPEDAFARYDYVYYLEQVGGRGGPRDIEGPGRPDAWPPGVMGFGTDGGFRDVDLGLRASTFGCTSTLFRGKNSANRHVRSNVRTM